MWNIRPYNHLILSLILISTLMPFAYGQKTISGVVWDENQEPIPYVNIGIRDTYVGTISELNGEFELVVPGEFETGTILFSCVGYFRTTISIAEYLGNEVEIVLKQDVQQLNDIVVVEKKIKPKIEKVGKPHSTEGRFMADTTYSGSAIAQLIETPFDTTFIHWVTLGYTNKIEGLKMRIKFKSVANDGRPGDLLINKDVIVEVQNFDGYDRFDLEKEFLFVTVPQFYVEFEQLVMKEDRKNIHSTITSAISESPDLVKYNEYGEFILDNEQLDLRFIQFKVSGDTRDNAYYRTSSFGKWYPSEDVAVRVGISDGSSENESQQDLTESRVLGLFNKKNKKATESSINTYENDTQTNFTSLADFLRRVGSLSVSGKGQDITVTVRGLGSASFKLSNEPIFVVDGLNIGRGYSSVNNSVDVNQIESIRVLKGPAQTAIYGEEGKNGVVIIKTRGN